jgi:hypothetical protein
LALSFQDNAGCLDIWRQITRVQSRAAEWYSSKEQQNSSVTDMAHAVAAAHHASLQRQQQHTMWEHVASEAARVHLNNNNSNTTTNNTTDEYSDSAEAVAVNMAAAAAAAYGNHSSLTEQSSSTTCCSLPNPPTLQNLEEIADIIAAAQVRRMSYTIHMYMYIHSCIDLSILLFFHFGKKKKKATPTTGITGSQHVEKRLLLSQSLAIALSLGRSAWRLRGTRHVGRVHQDHFAHE